MLTLKFVRENPDVIKQDLEKRKDTEKLSWVDEVLELDKRSRELKKKSDSLRSERNNLSEEINRLKKEGRSTEEVIAKVKEMPGKIKEIDSENDKITERITFILMRLPNILHESVPHGESDEDNEVLEEIGEKPEFSFSPKSHVDLLHDLNLADLERAAKIAGARFYFLRNDLALLEFALQKYAIDFMTKKGFEYIQTPYMMNAKAYSGVTDISDFEDVMYKIDQEDLYLIATSEHPLTAMMMDEVIDSNNLPMKMTSLSPCFRKEAGSHGKDTKGIFRVHQFNKVEQVVFCHPRESWKYFDILLENAKDFFKSLDLPFRVVNICTGDIGIVASKKCDLEVWMPAQNTYREIVSCSNCTEYQSARLGIKFRDKDQNKFVHTLNSTCVATSRALVAILENNQTEDGSIKVPEVLVPYMNGKEKIGKN